MEDRFFKYALIVSIVLHVVLFVRIYIERREDILSMRAPELSYEIQKAEPAPERPSVVAQEAMDIRDVPDPGLNISVPDMLQGLIKAGAGFEEAFKMYEREPERVKGMKVTKEVSVPVIQSEKINSPSYVTYYQIVRDRIRDRAYTNYTRLSAGEVFLSFIIRSDGTLVELQVLEQRSTANDFLREVGLRSVREASPFPPFPKELDYPELTFNVQISFQYREE
ncbi:MAG: energy transducer TonB [Elusimicrobia bacterium]|nr:energy transducer TonB [Elusimicrobiota bacterium]